MERGLRYASVKGSCFILKKILNGKFHYLSIVVDVKLKPIFIKTRPYNVFKTIFSPPHEWEKTNQRLLDHWKYFPCLIPLFILWKLINTRLQNILLWCYMYLKIKSRVYSSTNYLSPAPAFKVSWKDLVLLRVFNFKILQSWNHDTEKVWKILWKKIHYNLWVFFLQLFPNRVSWEFKLSGFSWVSF